MKKYGMITFLLGKICNLSCKKGYTFLLCSPNRLLIVSLHVKKLRTILFLLQKVANHYFTYKKVMNHSLRPHTTENSFLHERENEKSFIFDEYAQGF